MAFDNFFKQKLAWWKLSPIDLFPTIRCQNQFTNEIQQSESLWRAYFKIILGNFCFLLQWYNPQYKRSYFVFYVATLCTIFDFFAIWFWQQMVKRYCFWIQATSRSNIGWIWKTEVEKKTFPVPALSSTVHILLHCLHCSVIIGRNLIEANATSSVISTTGGPLLVRFLLVRISN